MAWLLGLNGRRNQTETRRKSEMNNYIINTYIKEKGK